MKDPIDFIAGLGVVPVIAIERVADAIPLADALLEGGLPIAEITFRTSAAAEVLAKLRDSRPELCIGAGTVLDETSLDRAVAAGARFALAPGFDADVVAAAARASLPFYPGVMTPSDLTAASRMGLKLVKFFPAGAAGGPSMLESVAAPFTHLGLRFIPTGGVTLETIGDWLKLNSVVAVGGTWIARTSDIRDGRFDKIQENARAAVAAAARALDARK